MQRGREWRAQCGPYFDADLVAGNVRRVFDADGRRSGGIARAYRCRGCRKVHLRYFLKSIYFDGKEVMMSLHRTGPGIITIDDKYSLPGGIKALLSNYDIDGDTPKQEHLDFLNTRVAPLLVSHPAHIWLQGSASHSGSDQHNMDLSLRRVNKVVAHLVSRGVLMGQIQPSAVGETMAMSGVNEDQRDRAVAVLV